MASQGRRKGGVKATESGAILLRQAKSQLQQDDGRKITYEGLASIALLDRKTVERFFNRRDNVSKDSAIAICNALSLDYCQVVDCSSKAEPKQLPKHDLGTGRESTWSAICRSMLERHRRLTTNEWLTDPDSHFNVEDIHVPLALLEHRTRQVRGSNHSTTQDTFAHEVSEVCEIEQFSHDRFLDRILREGDGKTHGKRIAIIGEPGAGKTTLLQKIAFWILENELGLPIWVSLADLQLNNNRLEDLGNYLREIWLKRAVGLITPQIETEFSQLVQEGKIWLLLDGLDEISLPFMSALRQVCNLLEGWISTSRVVLTCRVNVWESSLNALNEFETYRMGQFSPEQVEGFVENWFAQSNPQQGDNLQQALNDSQNSRIQDLVKSPLRLTLLCSIWQEDSRLPETKAALYASFIAALYRWKSDRFPISRREREQLDKALGELAKAAIDNGQSAYRLNQKLIDEHLDEHTLQLCLELGWLNSTGIAEEDKSHGVYAFIHPTFQEYFAALSVEDGDFFFEPDAEAAYQRSYRIFDARWREPLLVWFGFSHISNLDKDLLLRKLIYFEDQCEKLYEYRSVLIAASCLTEFPESEYKDDILDQVFNFAFGHPPECENILNEEGYILWFDYAIGDDARNQIFSGDFPATESIEYMCDLFERIYYYLYSEVVGDDWGRLTANDRSSFLKPREETLNKRFLARKFESEAIQGVPNGSPSFLYIHLWHRLKQFPVQKEILRNRLTSILENINDLFDDFHRQSKIWDLIEKIDYDLGFAWHLADLLLTIDPCSEMGFTTIKRILFFSCLHEDNALYTLYDLSCRKQINFADKDADDPALYIAAYLFLASGYGSFDSNLLEASRMIASILSVRGQSLSDFRETVHMKFKDLLAGENSNDILINKLSQYIEACLKRDAEAAIYALESLRSFWNANKQPLPPFPTSDRDRIRLEIDIIKGNDSAWWRMSTEEEKKKTVDSLFSREEKRIESAKTDEEAFFDIRSKINTTRLHRDYLFSADDVISLLNESRYPVTVRSLRRKYAIDKECESRSSLRSNAYFRILYHCVENMPYEQFLAAWQSI